MSEHHPDPPAVLPTYVVEAVERQSPERLRLLASWAEALADSKQHSALEEFSEVVEEIRDDPDQDVLDVDESGGSATYTRMVDCGKDACTSCPHGPYRYRTYREGDRVVHEHLGRADE